MSDRLEIRIIGRNDAAGAFQAVTRDAQGMASGVEQSSRRVSLSLTDLNAKAAAVGAGLGAVALGLGQAGQAALDTQRQIDALGRQYGTASGEILRYTDEVQFMVNKDTRDTLRRVNRQLRDYYLERAEELTTSTAESLAAAQAAVRSSEQERQSRRKEIMTQLEKSWW